MAVGIIGTKCGMSRVFMQSGRSIPVTVIHATPNRVLAIRQYNSARAAQVTWGTERKHAHRAAAGQYRAAGVAPGSGLRELRLPKDADLQSGGELDVTQFNSGDRVDVTGRSKGKGFAGTVKRWNFHMQDATHGNSLSHRAPGSIGQCQFPGKVFKGKKMAGHMGDARVTVQNLEIIQVDPVNNLLLVAGAVPGAPGGQLELRPSIKSRGKSLLDGDEPVAAAAQADAPSAEAKPESEPAAEDSAAAPAEEQADTPAAKAESKSEPAAEDSAAAGAEEQVAAPAAKAESKSEPAVEDSADAPAAEAKSEAEPAKSEKAAEAAEAAEPEKAEVKADSAADEKADSGEEAK